MGGEPLPVIPPEAQLGEFLIAFELRDFVDTTRECSRVVGFESRTFVVLPGVTAAEAVGERPGSVTVQTNRSDSPATVWLVVSDSGVGMDEKTRERIFDPFFSTKGPGRGLGLAAVQGIVRSAGGELTVTSARGEGSIFEVRFPAGPATQEAPIDNATVAAQEAVERGGKVLVVDDEPMVRTMARDLLETAGFFVVEASTGVEAVELYRWDRTIEVIILDMTMPGMSGAEALREIRAIDGEARVILTSGYDGQDTVAELNDMEGVAFLQKPYRARTLLQKIAAVLKGHVGATQS